MLLISLLKYLIRKAAMSRSCSSTILKYQDSCWELLLIISIIITCTCFNFPNQRHDDWLMLVVNDLGWQNMKRQPQMTHSRTHLIFSIGRHQSVVAAKTKLASNFLAGSGKTGQETDSGTLESWWWSRCLWTLPGYTIRTVWDCNSEKWDSFSVW